MTESVSDFKARLALLMRERETGVKYSIMGASRAHECVVRGKDAAPTPSEVMMLRKQRTTKGKKQ